MRRITYGYHEVPALALPRLRERRLEAAKEDGKARFPKWKSVEATLDPELPATGPIRVEVTLADEDAAEYYANDNPGNLAVEAQRLAEKAEAELRADYVSPDGSEARSTPYGPGYPIAVELLTDALERLEREHFGDGWSTECDGCLRAAAIRAEIEALS